MNPRIYYPTDYIAVHGDKPFNPVVVPGLPLWIQKEMLALAITQRHVTYAIGALYHIANSGADKKKALRAFIADGVCLKNVKVAALDELTEVLKETARMELQAEPDQESLANTIIFALRSNYFLNSNCQPIGLESVTEPASNNMSTTFGMLSEAVSQGFDTITSGTGKIISYLRYISPLECIPVKRDYHTDIELESYQDAAIEMPPKEKESQEISDRPTTYGSFGNFVR